MRQEAHLPKRWSTERVIAVLLAVTGIVLALIAVFADALGIGGEAGFGQKQMLIFVAGIVLAALGGSLLAIPGAEPWLLRQRLGLAQWLQWASARLGLSSTHAWPKVSDLIVAGTLAFAVAGGDLWYSSQLGLLAYPPYEDGISYVLNAKTAYYPRARLVSSPLAFIRASTRHIVDPLAPLWQAALLFSFVLFGEGEWQAYTARFWPIFLIVLLVFWLVRRQSGWRLAAVAALFTALLPTISVGIRSSFSEYWTGHVNFFAEWFLADLRSDLLAAALCVWAVMLLVEHAAEPDTPTVIISSLAAGLAVLAKPSVAALVVWMWGIAGLWVLFVNRGRWRRLVPRALLAAAIFGLITIPWLASGGLDWLSYYLGMATTINRALYIQADTNLWLEVTYYFRQYPIHVGWLEAWATLAIGLAAAITARREVLADRRVLGAIVMALAAYLFLTIIPNKNIFAGLPLFILLWLVCWKLVAILALRWKVKPSTANLILGGMAGLHAAVYLAGSVYAVSHWPANERRIGPENLAVTIEIAQDLRALLGPKDCFTELPAYGYPDAMRYFMVDSTGATLAATSDPSPGGETIAGYIQRAVQPCAAVLVFEEPMAETSKFFGYSPLRFPYYDATRDWVRQPEHGYQLHMTYLFHINAPPDGNETYRLGNGVPRTFVAELYLKQPLQP